MATIHKDEEGFESEMNAKMNELQDIDIVAISKLSIIFVQPEDRTGKYVVIYPYGEKHWYKDCNLHREDGPAIEHSNGDKEWYKDGKLHREDGPAQEWYYGLKKYWYEDKHYPKIKSDKEWQEFLKLKFMW